MTENGELADRRRHLRPPCPQRRHISLTTSVGWRVARWYSSAANARAPPFSISPPPHVQRTVRAIAHGCAQEAICMEGKCHGHVAISTPRTREVCAQAVVLDGGGHEGAVLNRRTDVGLSTLLRSRSKRRERRPRSCAAALVGRQPHTRRPDLQGPRVTRANSAHSASSRNYTPCITCPHEETDDSRAAVTAS